MTTNPSTMTPSPSADSIGEIKVLPEDLAQTIPQKVQLNSKTRRGLAHLWNLYHYATDESKPPLYSSQLLGSMPKYKLDEIRQALAWIDQNSDQSIIDPATRTA